MRLRLRNAAAQPLRELVLHLYPEAFRRGSVFEAESRRPAVFEDPREVFPRPGDEGSLQILDLTLDGVPAAARREGTLLRVALPEGLEPGHEIELSCGFTTRLPRFAWRSGAVDGFVFAGQWYPQLAAFDPELGRFETHEYHRFGEFESDVGDYEVELHVPEGLTVGATGEKARTTTGVQGAKLPGGGPGGSAPWLFEARNVRDFAWVAGPYTQDLVGDTRHGVRVRVLCRRSQAAARRLLDEAVAALEELGARYGGYPYPELTVAETPIEGGMEYPALVFIGEAVIDEAGSTELEVVTHEVAHQWWAMLVGNNGLDEAWIDEGLATYTTASVLDERLAPRKLGLHVGPPLGWVWPSLSFREAIELAARFGDGLWPARPIVGAEPPWPDPVLYTTAVYARAARALFELEDELGRQRMDALLRGLVRRHAFRGIDTEAFLAEAQAAGGSAALRRALEEPPQDPLRWPKRVRFFALGPLPVSEGLAVGLLPVFGGRRRDQLVAGVRVAASTPLAIRGPYLPFFWLPRLGLTADLLRRLDSGQTQALLVGTAALGRQAAVEARAELGGGTRLYQAEASWLRGRSSFAGPFRLMRAALRREEASRLDLLTARAELRWDGTETLLAPRRGPAARVWAEAGRDLEAGRWTRRAGLQAGAFWPLGRNGLAWAGLAAAASREHPPELSAEEQGWLTAWPGRFTTRLAAARAELMLQPKAPATLGWAVAGGLLAGEPGGLAQAGPTLRLFGELPFSVQLDLPLWRAGGPEEGFAWRWAVRIGPRVAD